MMARLGNEKHCVELRKVKMLTDDGKTKHLLLQLLLLLLLLLLFLFFFFFSSSSSMPLQSNADLPFFNALLPASSVF